MAKINTNWGNCIKELLRKHNLTLRGACIRAEGTPSHTAIRDWSNGIVPRDKDLAYHFLSYFPRDEAMECLEAVGFPPPREWEEQPGSPKEVCVMALRSGALSKEDVREIRAVVDDIIRHDC